MSKETCSYCEGLTVIKTKTGDVECPICQAQGFTWNDDDCVWLEDEQRDSTVWADDWQEQLDWEDGRYDDFGDRYDDDPNPYHGTYSEE